MRTWRCPIRMIQSLALIQGGLSGRIDESRLQPHAGNAFPENSTRRSVANQPRSVRPLHHASGTEPTAEIPSSASNLRWQCEHSQVRHADRSSKSAMQLANFFTGTNTESHRLNQFIAIIVGLRLLFCHESTFVVFDLLTGRVISDSLVA